MIWHWSFSFWWHCLALCVDCRGTIQSWDAFPLGCQIINNHNDVKSVSEGVIWQDNQLSKQIRPSSFPKQIIISKLPRRMQKDLRNNLSLINLSCTNSTNVSILSKQDGHQLIVRRKVSNAQPRRKSGTQTQPMALKYIPLAKVATQENSISLPVSRQSSKENLHCEKPVPTSNRFQRHSEKIYHTFTSPDTHPEPQKCTASACTEQKSALTHSIRRITVKNERLQSENQQLQIQITDAEDKIKKLEQQLREKNLKIQEMGALLVKKDATCSKLHDSITEKYRQISKLEDIVNKLQKQILSSSNPQTFTPLSLESSRIINQLTSQLKYRQMENHILKKQQFDSSSLEEQIKTISKENALLKDRLTYYIRISKNIDADSCSSDSFSLSFSETSPLKRSGRLRMDNLQ